MSLNTDIPFARPYLGKEEEQAVIDVLRSGWLTTGKQTLAFEKEFAGFLGAPYAAGLSSATAGLHLALLALGIGPGDKVILPVFTFTATAAAVHYTGAEAVFTDIDPATLNMSPAELIKALDIHGRDKVKAVIPVHFAGYPCDMPAIKEAAAGIPVIEDAAHAFPVETPEGTVGTLGDIGVFSFYANKTITTGEGGMAVTSNEELYRQIKRRRLHGIDRDVWGRYTEKGAGWQYDVTDLGYKYNMTDIAAAIGRVQLTRAKSFKKQRGAIAERYLAGLKDSGYLLPVCEKDHAWHLFVLRTEGKDTRERQQVIDHLTKQGIGSSVHFIPLHLLTYYSNRYNLSPEDYPRALHAFDCCFSIPVYPGMRNDQVDRVIEALKEV